MPNSKRSPRVSEKIVLDLCGGTGSWSKPYKDAGYDVRVITLPDQDVCTYTPPENVYGILAAPPCTMFSLARTTAKTPRNFYEGMKIVEAVLQIIWKCRKNNKLAFWALENPMGYLRQFLGKPPFTFHPYEFGDRYMKKTDIWGYFNFPKKTPVILTQEEMIIIKKGHGNPIGKVQPWLKDKKLTIADRRAITPQGFAKAFFNANL